MKKSNYSQTERLLRNCILIITCTVGFELALSIWCILIGKYQTSIFGFGLAFLFLAFRMVLVKRLKAEQKK